MPLEMPMSLLSRVSLAFLVAATPLCAAERHAVPAEFRHDQVWVTPRLQGERLRFFTDTGGGFNAIADRVAERAGMPRETLDDGELVAWPRFDEGAGIPPAPRHFMDGRLAVAPAAQLFGGDGFLGGRWFADGVWEFDYPRGTLHRLAGFVGDPAHPHRAPLGFQTNDAGARTMHFPSIAVSIDGETLPMLYDSGATATLTASAAPAFGVAPGTHIGTSFIETSVLERWVQAHPDWKLIEAADQMGKQPWRMIEVPQLTVAGHTVGPVWFAERPDGAFQSYMAKMMDRPTRGALGGSALKYFRVVLDYPGAAAYFHREPSAP
jgi:hypothetical protein